MAILAAALILAGSFPVFTVRADQEAGGEITLQEGSEASGTGTNDQEHTETPDTETPDIEAPDTESPDTGTSDTEDSQTADAGTFDTKTSDTEPSDTETSDIETSDTETSDTETCNTGIFDIEDSQTPGNDNADDGQILDTGPASIEETAEYPVPEDPPEFHARIMYASGGHTVIGTFADFTPDITRICTLYSLDGEKWEKISPSVEWNLYNLGTEDKDQLYSLQNQSCLFESYEPLKSYVAGEIDRFYMKLLITKQNGFSYDTQSAIIERSGLQPVPEGTILSAYFSDEMVVEKMDPKFPRRKLRYGRYQLTVSSNATVDDISGFLPRTLPVRVYMEVNGQPYTYDVVDCPVSWKALSLPQLSAGESITVSDAAEKVTVPAGTRLETPLGIFQLDEQLNLDSEYGRCNEVELVLNVRPKDESLKGALKYELKELLIALSLKPTNATSVRAYVLSEGESGWTELTGLSLLEKMNAQLANDGSGYIPVLRSDQEPLRSYLEDEEAGKTPTPFFVGLKIEGGIYDGEELILAWPGDYGQLPDLPKVGGSGGNEGNAGAANKNDSTESGQRPNLPQTPDADREEQQPDVSLPTAVDDNGQEQQPESSQPQTQDSRQESQRQILSEPDNNGQNQVPVVYISETADVITENQTELVADETVSDQQETGQRPDLSRTAPDTAGTPDVSQENGLTLEPFVVQAAAVEDIQEAGIVSDTPVLKTAVEPAIKPATSTGRGIFTPFLVVTTTTAVGGCIGAAVFKITGHSLFRQLAGTIRKLLHITK